MKVVAILLQLVHLSGNQKAVSMSRMPQEQGKIAEFLCTQILTEKQK